MMSDRRESTPLIHVGLFVSNDLEDEGLSYMIAHQHDMARCCHWVIQEPRKVRDVGLCDWTVPDVVVAMLPIPTLEALSQEFRYRAPPARLVAIVQEPCHWSHIIRILNIGVVGLTSAMGAEAILSMIRLAYHHQGGVDSALVQRLLHTWGDDGLRKMTLKPFDYEVWGLMAQGWSNPAIAHHCHVSISKPKRSVVRIFRYLGVHDRTCASALSWTCVIDWEKTQPVDR